MSARVRIEVASDEYTLTYRRYHIRRVVRTGTRSRAEAEAMAAAIETTLVTEQERKAARRPDWRPAGVEAPPVPTRAEREPFNGPRIVKR
jgi:hypothetical protein